jgi:hypothetical protein
MDRLHVFLSSPGDVSRERQLAREVLDQLESERTYRDRLKIEVVAWDKPGADTAMPAQMEPQEAIDQGLKKPSNCDIVIVIFWSRMGTPLSDKHRKPDGRPYRSGTEYEFVDAINAAKERGKTNVLVYRCLKEPSVGMKDPERDEKNRQWDLVEEFFAELKNADGSFRRFSKSYNEPHEFRQLLERDIRGLIEQRFDTASPETPHITQKPEPSWDKSKPPFPGLRTFTTKESPIFYGRDREIDQLVQIFGDSTSRFLLHCLPSRFVRIRHYGFLANRNRSANLATIRQLMGLSDPADNPAAAAEVMIEKLTGIDITVCPNCRKGKMQLFREIPKGRARPPNPLAYAAA